MLVDLTYLCNKLPVLSWHSTAKAQKRKKRGGGFEILVMVWCVVVWLRFMTHI
jgi:hypothetical protein